MGGEHDGRRPGSTPASSQRRPPPPRWWAGRTWPRSAPRTHPGAAASRAAASPSTWARVRSVRGEVPPMASVAAHQLGEELGGGGPAPSDGGVEGLDPLGGGRGPVGHDQHADRPPSTGRSRPRPGRPATTPARPSAWTSSTTRSRMPGSVSGRTPWPRLKTCPGAEPAAAEHLAGLGLGHLPGGEAQGRVEVALDGQPGPDPPPGLVQRHPPVDADHRAPGGGHRGQQLAGAHPEEDGGDAGVGLGQLGEEPPGGRAGPAPR